MILHSNLTKVSGPPGTGKSTYLLNVVERLLNEGVDSKRIIFTTFTRAGAYEARDRACDRFKLTEHSLPYFRTIHSLCYQLLPQSAVMQNPDWFAIARKLGIGLNLGWVKGSEGEIPLMGHTQRGDYLMLTWMLSRVRCQSLAQAFAERIPGPEVSLAELEHFAATVEAYKQEYGKRDFTDMMEDWLEQGTDPRATHVIVDEAQDISLLQGKVVAKLCTRAKEVWVAGDDDQCIHEWNGADPRWFIGLKARKELVLPQSFRIPVAVQKLAMGIVDKIGLRIPKDYRPRQSAGKVTRVDTLDHVDMKEGTWFLLARNQAYLEDFIAHCRRVGLLYTSTSGNTVSSAVGAIASWRLLCGGGHITGHQAKLMYTHMSRSTRIKNGFKQAIENVDDAAPLEYSDLVETYGLLASREMAWPVALDRITPEERSYLEAVERSGNLESAPRIEIGTIHSVKGREADHVVLRPEMTPRTYDGFRNSPDAEHRVWYVGATRAKETLYVLPPSTQRSYPL